MLQVAFYKGIRPGLAGIYSAGVQFWTKSKYSHCELIFKDGMSASASFTDKGVRFKKIDYNPDHWDIIQIPDHFEAPARAWFEKHAGAKYDLLGNLHFVFSAIGDDNERWFCSEALAAALGIENPWRFDPGILHEVILWMAVNSCSVSKEAA